MIYPNEILAIIIMCRSRECGPAYARLAWDPTALDPTYYLMQQGVITYARCRQVTVDDDGFSWELRVRISNGNPCYGYWVLQRIQPLDDPTGDYAASTNGQPDPSLATANVGSMDILQAPPEAL